MENYPGKTQAAELLSALKNYLFLAPYNLTLYYREKGGAASFGDGFRSCGAIIQDQASDDICHHFFEKSIKADFKTEKTSVYRYSGGFICFVVPFDICEATFCLVGNGVRDKAIDLWQLEKLSRRDKVDVFSLLNQLEKLPVATIQEVEAVAEQIQKILPALQVERSYKSLFDRTVRQLSLVVGVVEQLDKVATIEETISLSSELLAFLFDFPKIAIALRDEDGRAFSMAGTWGLPEKLGSIPEENFAVLVSRDKAKKTVSFGRELRDLLPSLQVDRVICFPLESEGALLGGVTLFDSELQTVDLLLVELVVGKVAARLTQLKREAEHLQVSLLSHKLMSLTNTLLFAESKEELYKIILELAADLLSACQGSIMLIDGKGENLHIVFSMGMSQQLANGMTVKVGKWIAGKVAKTGTPLLVNDVEKDSRVGMKNRPRFKSKSLICIPLKLKDKIIGVLNLSDKENLGAFTEADMNLLTSFADLASLMIERTLVLEESSMFEKLSVTDPLTGLYNRRFLKNRLEEELNRSVRHGLNLTVLFIDLDYFKVYNDLCGHLAGDEALKKTADIIKASLRDMDVVTRYGGEEFCAILPGTSKHESVAVAERIRGGIEKGVYTKEESLPLGKLTASLGIASFPEDGLTFTSIVHAADVALYEAKAKGRNQIVVAHPSMVKELKSART